MRSRRKLVFLLATVMLGLSVATTAAVWWLQEDSSKDALPPSVCKGYVTGADVAELLSEVSGEFEEESREFPGNNDHLGRAICEVHRGGETVSFRVQRPASVVGRASVERTEQYPVELGRAYGYFATNGRSLTLNVPCPAPSPLDTDTLTFVTGASVASGDVRRGSELSPQAEKLATVTANMARELTRKVYKCGGAGRLPHGPVRLIPQG